MPKKYIIRMYILHVVYTCCQDVSMIDVIKRFGLHINGDLCIWPVFLLKTTKLVAIMMSLVVSPHIKTLANHSVLAFFLSS